MPDTRKSITIPERDNGSMTYSSPDDGKGLKEELIAAGFEVDESDRRKPVFTFTADPKINITVYVRDNKISVDPLLVKKLKEVNANLTRHRALQLPQNTPDPKMSVEEGFRILLAPEVKYPMFAINGMGMRSLRKEGVFEYFSLPEAPDLEFQVMYIRPGSLDANYLKHSANLFMKKYSERMGAIRSDAQNTTTEKSSVATNSTPLSEIALRAITIPEREYGSMTYSSSQDGKGLKEQLLAAGFEVDETNRRKPVFTFKPNSRIQVTLYVQNNVVDTKQYRRKLADINESLSLHWQNQEQPGRQEKQTAQYSLEEGFALLLDTKTVDVIEIMEGMGMRESRVAGSLREYIFPDKPDQVFPVKLDSDGDVDSMHYDNAIRAFVSKYYPQYLKPAANMGADNASEETGTKTAESTASDETSPKVTLRPITIPKEHRGGMVYSSPQDREGLKEQLLDAGFVLDESKGPQKPRFYIPNFDIEIKLYVKNNQVDIEDYKAKLIKLNTALASFRNFQSRIEQPALEPLSLEEGFQKLLNIQPRDRSLAILHRMGMKVLSVHENTTELAFPDRPEAVFRIVVTPEVRSKTVLQKSYVSADYIKAETARFLREYDPQLAARLLGDSHEYSASSGQGQSADNESDTNIVEPALPYIPVPYVRGTKPPGVPKTVTVREEKRTHADRNYVEDNYLRPAGFEYENEHLDIGSGRAGWLYRSRQYPTVEVTVFKESGAQISMHEFQRVAIEANKALSSTRKKASEALAKATSQGAAEEDKTSTDTAPDTVITTEPTSTDTSIKTETAPVSNTPPAEKKPIYPPGAVIFRPPNWQARVQGRHEEHRPPREQPARLYRPEASRPQTLGPYTGPETTLTLDTSVILPLTTAPRDKEGHTHLDIIRFLSRLPSVRSQIIPATVAAEVTLDIPNDIKHNAFTKIGQAARQKITDDQRKFIAESGLRYTDLEGNTIATAGKNPKQWIWESANQQKSFRRILNDCKGDYVKAFKMMKDKGEMACLLYALTAYNGHPVIVLTDDRRFIREKIGHNSHVTMDGKGIGFANLSCVVHAVTQACGKDLSVFLNEEFGGSSKEILTYQSIADAVNARYITGKKMREESRFGEVLGQDTDGTLQPSLHQVIKLGVNHYRAARNQRLNTQIG
jgi:hypothetical protein